MSPTSLVFFLQFVLLPYDIASRGYATLQPPPAVAHPPRSCKTRRKEYHLCNGSTLQVPTYLCNKNYSINFRDFK